jgi:excinuclease ABC subunit C
MNPPQEILLAPDRSGLEDALAAVPDLPAVFLVWPGQGAPYLGRTRLLRRRLQRLLGERARPSRWLNLREVAARIEYWLVGADLESALLHYELARRHFPEDYPRRVKLWMPFYLKVILSNRFPRCQLTRRLGGSSSLYYGPFRSRAAAEQFESGALDFFQVRRCQEDLEPSRDHPGCAYGEMGMCLRPCQAVVSEGEYRGEVSRLVQFLATGGESLLASIAAARERSSAELDFEEAARQHRRWEKVQELLRRLEPPAGDIDRLHGVAVTRAAAPDMANLWFVLGGCWQPPVPFATGARDSRIIPLDARLREAVAGLRPSRLPARVRQEHLALLARWYHSSSRQGEWLAFPSPDAVPFRKLVRAVHRAALGRSDSGQSSARENHKFPA